MNVSELLSSIEIPFRFVVVKESTPIRQIIDEMVFSRDDRVVYVADNENCLEGIISLGDLVRHYLSEKIPKRGSWFPSIGILHYLTAETAGDIMKKKFVSCGGQDDIEDVLARMISRETMIKVIPVLDENGQIIAALDILDIIKNSVK